LRIAITEDLISGNRYFGFYAAYYYNPLKLQPLLGLGSCVWLLLCVSPVPCPFMTAGGQGGPGASVPPPGCCVNEATSPSIFSTGAAHFRL
jgi:hypothetical protein